MTGLLSRHLNAVESDSLPFVLPIGLESGPSVGNVRLKIWISQGKGPTLRPNPDRQEP